MIRHYLESVAADRSLSPRDFERAGIRVAERRYGAKDTIFAPGDPDGQLYFVVSGTVRLYKIYGDYKEATVALLKGGDVFGELSLQQGLWQTAYAIALTDARVIVVRKDVMAQIVKRDPDLAMKLFASFSERLKQSEEVMGSLLQREVSARLVALLQNLGERFGKANRAGTVIELRLTHQDLASMIASTREAVSKVMSEFQRAGLIEVSNRRIILGSHLAGDAFGGSPTMPGAA